MVGEEGGDGTDREGMGWRLNGKEREQGGGMEKRKGNISTNIY
jgi:hypothetical protein